MSSQLNLLLTHFLSSGSDYELEEPLAYALAVLERDGETIFASAESVALARWSNKISTLVNNVQTRTSGLKLAGASLARCPPLWASTLSTNPSNAKGWFDQAYKLVQKPGSLAQLSQQTASAAVDFLAVVFTKLPIYPAFAQSVMGGNTASRLADALLNYCQDHSFVSPVSHNAYTLLVVLLKTQGVALKNTAAKFEEVTSANIVHPGAQRALSHFYLITGKAESVNTWKRTAEGIASSLRSQCLPYVTTSLQVQTQSSLPKHLTECSPLKLPPLPTRDGSMVSPSDLSQVGRHMDRITALVQVLSLMLSTPTERQVTVPSDVLLGLAIHMLSFSPVNTTAATTDPTVRSLEVELMSEIHLLGAGLAVQIAQVLGPLLAHQSSDLLGAICQAADQHPANSSQQAGLYLAYGMYAERAGVDLDEPTFQGVWRSLLAKVAALRKVSQDQEPPLEPTQQQQKGKKRQKKDEFIEFEAKPKIISEQVIDAAELALESLSRLARLPNLSEELYLVGSKVALNMCQDPDFFNICPGQNFVPAILRNSPRLAPMFEYRPVLRTLVLKLLQELVAVSRALKFPAFLQTATTTFLEATLFTQPEVADVGRQGAILCQHILHPALPALPVNASVFEDSEAAVSGSTNGIFQAEQVEEAADESAPSSSDDEEQADTASKSKYDSGPSTIVSPSDMPSAIPHIPAEAVPSASALEVDADDTISGPQPVHPDDEAESAGNESTNSKKQSATKRKHTRRYSGDVHPDNILADTGRSKRARRSETTSQDPQAKDSQSTPDGPLTVRPYDGTPANKKNNENKDASAKQSPGGGSLRVLPYPQSQANKPRKPLTSSQEQEHRRKSTSASSGNRLTSGSPEGGNSLLTADTEMMPAPSAGEFFKDTSPKEVTPKGEVQIDPAIMGGPQAETFPEDPKKVQRASPPVDDGNRNESALADSDDDGPIPQIVDSDDEDEEDEDGESDS